MTPHDQGKILDLNIMYTDCWIVKRVVFCCIIMVTITLDYSIHVETRSKGENARPYIIQNMSFSCSVNFYYIKDSPPMYTNIWSRFEHAYQVSLFQYIANNNKLLFISVLPLVGFANY